MYNNTMISYTDILNAMQIYGDKLDAVHVRWIDKDGIQIEDFVRLIFHNDLYVIFCRQMNEREETYKVDYSDIRSIHGMLVPTKEYEHEVIENEVECDDFIASVHTATFDDVVEMLKKYIEKYGLCLTPKSDFRKYSLESLSTKNVYVELERILNELKKHPDDMDTVTRNLGWFYHPENCTYPKPAYDKVSKVKGAIRNTLNHIYKHIPNDKRKLLNEMIYPLVDKIKCSIAKNSGIRRQKKLRKVYDDIEGGKNLLIKLMFDYDRKYDCDEYLPYIGFKLAGYTNTNATSQVNKRHQLGTAWNRKTIHDIDFYLKQVNVSDYEKRELVKMKECFM